MTVGPHTTLYTLIGDPVGHSLSPLIHNTAFEALSVDAVYTATRVRTHRLADAVRGLAALGFGGANVTIPHKLAVMNELDAVTDTARMVGAVNAIRIDRSNGDARLLGDNTDAAGFAGPLLRGDRTPPGSALILGAGGASRAVVHACLNVIGIPVVAITARREAQARELAERFAESGTQLNFVDWTQRTEAAGDAELVVNCTPLGMHPDTDTSPLEEAATLGPGQTVYDLVYAPAETRLLEEAAARGTDVIQGVEMLIGQAAAAFRWWTGREMPMEVVREAVRNRLGGRH